MTTISTNSSLIDRAKSRDCLLCDHCGLPVPAGLIEPEHEKQFCCNGCRTAYSVIHEFELDRYYTLRNKQAVAPSAARDTYEEFDSPTYVEQWVRSNAETTTCNATIGVHGMHCAACVWLLDRLPRISSGVLDSRVNLAKHTIDVRYNSSTTKPSDIAKIIGSLGYRPTLPRSVAVQQTRQQEDRRALIQLGIAGACAANTMLFAVALYAGALADMSAEHTRIIRWVSMAFSIVSVAWPGRIFLRSAFNHLRARTIGLDVPIAVALSVGVVWSIVSTLRDAGEVYYDSLSVLVFALLLARFIQQRQQRWATSAIEHIISLVPASARIVDENGLERVIPIDALQKNTIVLVKPGESVPADGIVIDGESHLDTSILTGESRPMHVSAGSSVFAGTQNESREIRVRVENTGATTRISKLMQLMEEGAAKKAPIIDLADKATAWFIGVISLVALLTWIFALPLGGAAATERTVSLLIVSCPCALGLATPMAISIALGRAAKRGVLIKSGAALQALAGSGILWLDKTGTVTTGSMQIVRTLGNANAVQLAASLERDIPHPIAHAIAAHVQTTYPDPEHVTYHTGRGVTGIVNGHSVVVGSLGFVQSELGTDAPSPKNSHLTPDDLDAWRKRSAGDALTPVFIAVDNAIVAAVATGDAVREDARDSVEQLTRLGWDVGLLSGDEPAIAEHVGSVVGIHRVVGGATPEHKLDVVTQALGTTIMVGDGVNDAAALAAATVGIAVHGGAEASLDAADIYLQHPGLRDIVSTVQLGKGTMRVVKSNLAISFLYNAGAITAATLGYVSPLVAAVLMPISSLTVVLNSLRAGRTDTM